MPTADQQKPGSTPLFLSAADAEMENGARANSVPLTAGTKLKKPERKKLNRRNDRDYSQRLRFTVQIVFAALNVWIGVQFYLWVRWAESGGRTFEVSRPAGVEGWLPIEGLTQLKYFFVTGNAPHVHAAGFFLFTSFLIISYAFRKAFCSWICPVGRSPNIYGSWAVHLIGCNFHLPRWSIYRFAR